MSTERQRQAARANGAQSHGPITPEGKVRSSQNALRHGLCSKEVVVQLEEAGDFDDYRRECYDELRPETRVECDLVDDIVAARWRLHRIRLMQAALLDFEISRQAQSIEDEFERIDISTRLALGFKELVDNSRVLELLNRYETRHERTIHRALALLLTLRKERIAKQTRQPENPVGSTASTGEAPRPKPLGFPDPPPPASPPSSTPAEPPRIPLAP